MRFYFGINVIIKVNKGCSRKGTKLRRFNPGKTNEDGCCRLLVRNTGTEDAPTQCRDLAHYQHDQLQAKGPVELTKIMTPVVEMETNEVKTQVDGYKVTAGNFTGRYTVQLIRAIRD